jgi:hypothetical protein
LVQRQCAKAAKHFVFDEGRNSSGFFSPFPFAKKGEPCDVKRYHRGEADNDIDHTELVQREGQENKKRVNRAAGCNNPPDEFFRKDGGGLYASSRVSGRILNVLDYFPWEIKEKCKRCRDQEPMRPIGRESAEDDAVRDKNGHQDIAQKRGSFEKGGIQAEHCARDKDADSVHRGNPKRAGARNERQSDGENPRLRYADISLRKRAFGVADFVRFDVREIVDNIPEPGATYGCDDKQEKVEYAFMAAGKPEPENNANPEHDKISDAEDGKKGLDGHGESPVVKK